MLRLLLIALAAGPVPRFDILGDPLPPGAVARLGSLRYRIGDSGVWALSPDGRTFAAADGEDVTLWDVATGRSVRRIPLPEPTTSQALAYSPDGTRLVCAATDEVHVLDPAAGCVRWSRGARFSSAIGFLPGGAEFYLAERAHARLIMFELGGAALDDVTLPDAVQRVSPCGRYFLRTDRFEDEKGNREVRVTLTAARTGRVCGELSDLRLECLDGSDLHPEGAAWGVSPDDRRLYVLTPPGRLLTFDIGTGRATELDPAPGWVSEENEYPDLAFSPDGAIAYLSMPGAPVRRRDLKAGAWLDPLPAMPRGRLVPHPDGRQVLHVGTDGLLRRIDLATCRDIRPPPGFVGGSVISPSPDGRRIAVASWAHGGGLAVLEAAGRLVWAVPAEGVRQIVWSPDGGQLAAVSEEGIVFREAATGKDLRRLTTPPDTRRGGSAGAGPLENLHRRFLREREVFALAGVGGRPADRAWALFNLTQERIDARWTPDDHALRRWAMHPFDSPDGAFLLTWEYGGLAVLRDPRTGDRLGGFATGVPVVNHYAFSPNGLWLAVADGETVSLWDAPTGQCLVTWKAPTHVTSVAFTGPGKLVTGLADETALVWSLKPRKKPAAPAWEAITGADPHDACRAVWALAADPAGPALFRKHIAPAVALPAAGRWIKDLDADRYALRERAVGELSALGPSAAGAMRTALDRKPSAEARMRLEGLLAGLPTYRQHIEIAHARAVLAMELAGTPAAREVLKAWAAGDPGATLTIDAKAALGRLGP